MRAFTLNFKLTTQVSTRQKLHACNDASHAFHFFSFSFDGGLGDGLCFFRWNLDGTEALFGNGFLVLRVMTDGEKEYGGGGVGG